MTVRSMYSQCLKYSVLKINIFICQQRKAQSSDTIAVLNTKETSDFSGIGPVKTNGVKFIKGDFMRKKSHKEAITVSP